MRGCFVLSAYVIQNYTLCMQVITNKLGRRSPELALDSFNVFQQLLELKGFNSENHMGTMSRLYKWKIDDNSTT